MEGEKLLPKPALICPFHKFLGQPISRTVDDTSLGIVLAELVFTVMVFITLFSFAYLSTRPSLFHAERHFNIENRVF